jgi:hypothetical protein
MSNISAEEWQFLSFFEVEPELSGGAIPWGYNDALYKVRQGDFVFSFAISPAFGDVRLILTYRDMKTYELNVCGAKDIRYRNEGKFETLEIEISDSESLTIRLKPHIELTHGVERIR